jgi:succinate-acetate transporter protein
MTTLRYESTRDYDGDPRSQTPAERATWDALRGQVRINVRPLASPSTVGLFGLATGTFVLSGLQLGWVPKEQGHQVALTLIGFSFVAQLFAAIVATLARDGVVASAMAVLSLTWLVTGMVLWVSEPAATSDALGMVLLVSCVTMALIGVTTATTKVVPGLVFLTASVRFGLTAIYELSAESPWKTAAGVVGLALAAIALYTGWAFLLESSAKRTVLPLGRRGQGKLAIDGSLLEQVSGAANEPGVRLQL